MTTFEPGASDVFTQGLRVSPFSTAFFASSAAPIITDGFEVFVQEVIAETAAIKRFDPETDVWTPMAASPFGGRFGFSALCNKGDEDTDDICWMMYNAVMDRPLGEDHRWLRPAPYPFSEPGMLTGGYICHEGLPVVVDVLQKEDGRLVAGNTDAEIVAWEVEVW